MEKIVILGATSEIAQHTQRILATQQKEMLLVARSADRLRSVAADLRVRGAKQVIEYTRGPGGRLPARSAALVRGGKLSGLRLRPAGVRQHAAAGKCRHSRGAVDARVADEFHQRGSLLTLFADIFEPRGIGLPGGNYLGRRRPRKGLQLRLRRGQGGAQRIPAGASRAAVSFEGPRTDDQARAGENSDDLRHAARKTVCGAGSVAADICESLDQRQRGDALHAVVLALHHGARSIWSPNDSSSGSRFR